MALLDVLKAKKKQLGPGPAPVDSGSVAAAQQTMATGKAGRATTGPAMSGVGSQLAAQAGQAQRGALNVQAIQQQQALGAQEQAQADQFKLAQKGIEQRGEQQQADLLAQETMQNQQRQAQDEMALKDRQAKEARSGQIMTNQYANALANLASQQGIAEQQIFEHARQVRSELDHDKYLSYLDQVAHSAAMSDQKYVDEITRIGQTRNLKDQLAFKKEAATIAFGNDFEVLQQDFDMQELINADKRQFQEIMSHMDINSALKLAEIAAKEAAYTNIIKGVAGMGAAYAASPGSTTTPSSANHMTGGQSVTSAQSFNPSAPATQTSAFSTQPQTFNPDINMTPASGFGPVK